MDRSYYGVFLSWSSRHKSKNAAELQLHHMTLEEASLFQFYSYADVFTLDTADVPLAFTSFCKYSSVVVVSERKFCRYCV